MEHLSRIGHEVRVIDFQAKGCNGGGLLTPRETTTRALFRTDPLSTIRLIRPGVIKVAGIRRASSFLPQFKSIFSHMIRCCDIIVLYSVPTNGLQTLFSSKILSKPIVFHSFDVLHRMTGYRYLVPPTWALERFVYNRVD